MDRFGTISIPRNRQQRTKARRVIVMMMSDKNSSDLSDINTSLRKTACDAVAGINDVMRPVDSQEIGRLHPVRSQRRTSRCAERDETSARFR